MFKVRILGRVSPILLLVVLALVPMTAPVFSQANNCPAFVTKVVQKARTVCRAVDNGQICYADALTSQFADNANFAKAGDLAPLSSLKTVAGQPGDVSALYPDPAQSISLESAAPADCTDTPNGLLVSSPNGLTARLLVNSVQLSSTGSAFLTAAAGGNLTVIGLTGLTTVTAGGKSVIVKPNTMSIIPLDKLQAKAAPSDPAEAASANLIGLYSSIVNGQPYSLDTIAANLHIQSQVEQAAVGEAAPVQMSYTGDAGTCPAADIKPQDVPVVVDTSRAL